MIADDLVVDAECFGQDECTGAEMMPVVSAFSAMQP